MRTLSPKSMSQVRCADSCTVDDAIGASEVPPRKTRWNWLRSGVVQNEERAEEEPRNGRTTPPSSARCPGCKRCKRRSRLTKRRLQAPLRTLAFARVVIRSNAHGTLRATHSSALSRTDWVRACAVYRECGYRGAMVNQSALATILLCCDPGQAREGF